MLRAIGVGNAVFGTGELLFDLCPPFFGLFLPDLALHNVGQLDDQVELAAAHLLVDHVHQVQLPDQALHRAVGLVHHGIERVFDDRHLVFRQGNLFLQASPVVVNFHPNIIRVPLQYLSDPHGFKFGLACPRVIVGVNGHQCYYTLVQHRKKQVKPQRAACLVFVAGKVQTRIKARINGFVIASVFIEPYMIDGDRRSIHCNAGVDGRHNRPVIGSVQPYPVGPVAVTSPNINFSGRVPVQKSIPGMSQSGAKGS